MAAPADPVVLRTRQSSLGTRGARAAGALLAVFAAGACNVSDRREVELGRYNADQIERQLPLVTDSVVGDYVQALGERLASRTSRANLEWHFSVIDSKDVNAFALPGGFVYVNRGLIERSDRMDELAGALGHEIGHVVRRHSVQQLKRVGGTKVGLALVCVFTNFCDSRTARVAIDVGGAAWLSHHSRAAEAEADSEAIANVVRAGISPEGIPELFETLLATRSEQPGRVEAFFASHPLEEDRIDATQRIIDGMDTLVVRDLERDDAEFQAVKQRLASLPPSTR